jgi:hypothetical protein
LTLKRVKHWETRALHLFLIERSRAPFVWGVNDCATFAADGIKAVTGVFRGKYHDEAGALATIAAVCNGSSVADAAAYCAEKHGLGEWPRPLFARRGDLVVFHNGSNLIAGLVHLSGRHLVTVGPSGLYRYPITAIARAWHYE